MIISRLSWLIVCLPLCTFSDINECLEFNGGCQQICDNSIGSFSCSCDEGYELSENLLLCDGKYRSAKANSIILLY